MLLFLTTFYSSFLSPILSLFLSLPLFYSSSSSLFYRLNLLISQTLIINLENIYLLKIIERANNVVTNCPPYFV